MPLTVANIMKLHGVNDGMASDPGAGAVHFLVLVCRRNT